LLTTSAYEATGMTAGLLLLVVDAGLVVFGFEVVVK